MRNYHQGLSNLADLPKEGGNVAKLKKAFESTAVDELSAHCRSRLNTVNWDIEMTALTAMIYSFLVDAIKWQEFNMERCFKNDDFWLNFAESLIIFIRKAANDWKNTVLSDQSFDLRTRKVLERYQSLYEEKHGKSPNVMPDFGDFVAVATYFGRLSEDKLTEMGRPVNADSVGLILGSKEIVKMQKQLMFNKNLVAADLLVQMRVMVPPKRKTPLPGSIYWGPFTQSYKFDPDKFDLKGDHLALKNSFLDEYVSADLKSKLMLDDEVDRVFGCPVLYGVDYSKIWEIFVGIYISSRFVRSIEK